MQSSSNLPPNPLVSPMAVTVDSFGCGTTEHAERAKQAESIQANDPNLDNPVMLGRVLHVINGEHFSGAERVQQLLGRRLPQYGFDADFACLKPDKFPELCGLRKEQIAEFPMRGRFDLRVVDRLSRYAVDRDVCLLHAHTPRTALITAITSRRTGLPWVYHVHSPTARDSTRDLVNRINDWIERFSIRSCQRLITVSRSLRREMLRLGVPRQRLQVVANGVPAIDPIQPDRRIQQTTWKLGMVALMRPRKGVEVALAAMSTLRQRGIPVSLQLIGGFETHEYERQTLKLVDSLGLENCVQWTGFTNDVPSAIRQLDALILPSLFGEGMPMVVLEALAAAVPVVATRVEGTPEVVRHGVEGLLAEPNSADSLAKQIEQLTHSREAWKNMSQNAVARHRMKFSDEAMAASVAKAYRRVLGT